jgi:hypothetical protein
MEKIAEMYIVSIFAAAMVALLFFGIVFFVDQYYMEKDKKQHND